MNRSHSKSSRHPDVPQNTPVMDTEDNKRAKPSNPQDEQVLNIHSASEGQ